MEDYHKIQSPFYRHMGGPNKGKLILGKWSRPEFEYLKDLEWTFTEKIDGTNIKIGFDGERVAIGGRTIRARLNDGLSNYLKETFGNVYPSSRWGNAFDQSSDITLYGEGTGPKIQGSGRYGDKPSFTLFDVNINGFWLDRENVHEIADKMGIAHAPLIGRGTLQDAIDIVTLGFMFNDHGGIMRYGNKGLESRWGKFEAEGVVARPSVPLFNRKGERVIVKIKGVDFR